MSEQINKEKMELIYKFERAMGKRKQIKPSLVKKLFPNDEKLYSRVKAMTDSVYKKEKNKSCDDLYRGENSNEYVDINEVDDKGTYITQDKRKKKVGNKSYSERSKFKCDSKDVNEKNDKNKKNNSDKKNENNILGKIEEFKKECYGQLNKVIEDEKKKEKERIEKYDNENDEDIKKKLQNEMDIERAKGNKLIKNMEKDIENKIKKYEEDLRKNNDT